MHLLCINLLVLVLLPSSLSCDNRAEPVVREVFLAIVKTHMDNTEGIINTSRQVGAHVQRLKKRLTIAYREELQNLLHLPCPERKYKPANCTTENVDIVETLLRQACEMHRLKLKNMTKLAELVQNSIDCTCPEIPTKQRSQRRRTPRNQEKKQMTKICKATAILSSMTVCYQRLNTKYMDAPN